MFLLIKSYELNWVVELTSINIIQILGMLFLAVLFIQSGLDKVLDWKGNYSWLKEHFSKSIFKDVVKLLLVTITVLELIAGSLSLIGALMIIVNQSLQFAFLGVLFSSVSLLALFTGQRIARDYAGAFSLVPYFILCLLLMYFISL